jgi:membrane protein required for colicin V production
MALIGLIRGFLKELFSIINWSSSFYLTSMFKPLVIPILKSKIKIPFLLDIVSNLMIFAILIIVITISTNYLLSVVKKIIPNPTNSGLGFIFGLLKGFLIAGIVVSFIKILYKNSSEKPDWIVNSYIYNSIDGDNVFTEILKNMLGDMVDLENIETKLQEKIGDEVEKQVKEKIEKSIGEELNIDEVEKIIKNTKENIIPNDNQKDIEKLLNIIIE